MVRSFCRIAAAALLTGAVTLIGAPRSTVSLPAGIRLQVPRVIEVSSPGTGGCTLIDAIHAANSDTGFGTCTAGSGADVISIPAGIYSLTVPNNTTHGLSTGLPIIVGHLTIVGAGRDATVIERAPGSPEFRLLRLWHVGSTLTIGGLTIRGGHGSDAGGAGIYANGPLAVHDARFENNDAGRHGGGAIRWSGWPLTISNTTFANNRAPAYEGGALMGNGDPLAPLIITNSRFEGNYAINGGAITYAGSGPAGGAGSIADTIFTANTALQTGGAMQIDGVTLARVTVTGNRVTAPGHGGGGMFIDGVTILDSTISNNVVLGQAAGGGVVTAGSALSRRVTISGTTFAGNSADTGGGASLAGLSTLTNVTFSGNESSGGGGALLLGGGQTDLNNVTIVGNRTLLARAGGVSVASFAIVRLRNTIVSGNFDGLGSPDCHSTGHALQSLGHNLIGLVGACNYVPGPGDLVGTSSLPIDARLGSLRDNGGATWTHEPAATSPAVDGGSLGAIGTDPTACEALDQRGAARPERAACDIGAVERKNRAPEVTPDTATTAEDTAVDIAMTATDEDGDPLTVAVSATPVNGVLSGSFPAYSYTPARNFNGADSFTVLARDALGANRSVTVKITVTPVNDPPAAVDDEISVPANAAVQSIPVLDNDSTPDAGEVLAVTAVTLPAHGTVAIGAGGTTVSYTPSPNYSGADTFTYTVADATGLTATGRVNVTVVPSADLSAGVSASPTALAGGPLSYIGTMVNRGVIAATNAAISFTFPSPPTLVAHPAGCVLSGPSLTCAVGTIAVGQTANVSVTIEAPAAASLTTAVTVGAAQTDPRLDNNTASVTTPITPAADLVLSVSDDPDPVAVNASLAYRVLVRNRAGVTATGIKIAATFPASGGATEVSEFGVSPLSAGAEATTLIVRVPQTSGIYNAHFSVSATQTESAPLNNAESEQTIVGTAVAVVNSTGLAGDVNPANSVCDTGGGAGGPECTLRAAIETANTTPGTIIAFRIPAGERGFADGVFTIQPDSNLPAITADGTIVEATTQTSFTGDTNPLGPEIVLRGALNRDASPTGLRIEASNVVVRGLVINGFATGVACTATSCGRGIYVQNENRSVTGTRVEGNYIGLTPTGAVAAANGRGIEIGVGAADSLVGGTATGHGNVISGNADAGIFLHAVSDRTTIHGNFVGTNRTGLAAVPNGAAGGIVIDGANATVIGGAANGAGNVVSGNSGFGIVATSLLRQVPQTPIQTSISGNLIGTDVTGTLALGNEGGVLLSGDGQWLAGTTPGSRTVISGNRASGVVVAGQGRSFILGNYIGTDVTGLLPLPNGGATAADAGVKVVSGTTAIGGYGFGDANVIAFNNGDGVLVEQSALTAAAAIRGNAIHGNTRLGIDVGANGVSPAKAPAVTAVGQVGATTVVTGTFLALPNQVVGVELFGNTTCDPTGYGEGITPLHAFSAAADAGGHVRFRAILAGALDSATLVTAVATEASGQSSEFSACTAVGTGLSDLAVQLTPSRDPGWSGFDLTWQVKVTNTGAANSDIRVSTVFPAGIVYSTLPPVCSRSDDVVTCVAPALASGANVVFDIVVKPAAVDSIAVAASVTGYEPDPNTANDLANATVPLVEAPSVVLTVTEQITVQESLTVRPAVMVAVSEQIHVEDALVVRPAVMLNITEQIHVADGPAVQGNTPVGTGVQVAPAGSASVTFATVTGSGATSLALSSTGPALPPGVEPGTPPVYYDITTTATYTGAVTVCLTYAETSYPSEAALRLYHYEAGAWADVTTTLDTTANVICGVTSTLSPFVIARREITTPGDMHGDGFIQQNGGKYVFDFRVTEQPRAGEGGRFRLDIIHGGKGRKDDRFVAREITAVAFSDDPTSRPGRPPRPAIDTVVFSGTGEWNGGGGYRFEVRATDEGEGGRHRDSVAITVSDPSGHVVVAVAGEISGGNVQSKRLKN